MNVLILSKSAQIHATRRLAQAAGERGHRVMIRHPLHFTLTVRTGQPELFYHRRPVTDIDVAIPRIGASATFFGLALVRQLEMMDIPCLNSSTAIRRSRDKLLAFQILSTYNIGLPATAFAAQPEDVKAAIHSVGGPPVIVKLLQGAQGVGVMLAETVRSAEGIVDAFQSLNQNILIQEYVASSRGRDIRAVVIGGRVAAAMRRVPEPGGFRSNLHQGGAAEPIRIPPEYERTAIEVARILNLSVAGVDMLECPDGPRILEVNSSPGLEGIEAATGVDLATQIVIEAEKIVVERGRKRIAPSPELIQELNPR